MTSPEQQALAMRFRTRKLLLVQKARLVNALRAHLAEHGSSCQADADPLPPSSRPWKTPRRFPISYAGRVPFIWTESPGPLAETRPWKGRSMRMPANDIAQRLRTLPGVGPVTAMAVEAFAPAMESLARGRDVSAWLGLVPRQYASGGKQRLGKTSKMGQRDSRRLLICGAMSGIHRKGLGSTGKAGSWLSRMLACKSRMGTAIALANNMARIIRAILTRKDVYKDPAGAVC